MNGWMDGREKVTILYRRIPINHVEGRMETDH